MESTLKRTWAEIDLDALAHNYGRLRQHIGTKVRFLGVVKADAYGHGAVQVARTLQELGADYLAVSSIDEAMELRANGVTMPVLILGHTPKEQVGRLIEHHITQAVTCKAKALEYSREAAALGGTLKIHIKVDTGMSRLGFRVDEAAELADYLRTLKEVRPVLIMSHLAASDTPALDDFTHEQARRFHEATESMKAVFPGLKTSLTNSPGLLCWPSYVGDLARPGVTLYGGNPLHGTDRAKLGMGLLPVMEMAAPVLSVHPVVKGATVSYGCLYTAPKDIRAAVVGAGYADGYPRSLSMRGSVLIRGQRAPILGRVCMQMCIVDVTDIPGVEPGDTAYLLGGSGPLAIRPEELAEWWGTISYEVFCALGRNRRVSEKKFSEYSNRRA